MKKVICLRQDRHDANGNTVHLVPGESYELPEDDETARLERVGAIMLEAPKGGKK
jgi:hypothetical protein